MQTRTKSTRNELKTSKEPHTIRLFVKDDWHIRNKVKTLKFTDPKFKDFGAAIRHYVHLSIINEKRAESVQLLDDRLFKSAQTEVLTDSVQPLTNAIEALLKATKEYGVAQAEFFNEANRQNERLANRFDAANEHLAQRVEAGFAVLTDTMNQNFAAILSEVLQTGKIGTESLRNIFILRSILYVFLLGHKTGKIIPERAAPWHTVVTEAHAKARELSDEELQHFADGTLENEQVLKMAREMFRFVGKMHQDLMIAPKPTEQNSPAATDKNTTPKSSI